MAREAGQLTETARTFAVESIIFCMAAFAVPTELISRSRGRF